MKNYCHLALLSIVLIFQLPAKAQFADSSAFSIPQKTFFLQRPSVKPFVLPAILIFSGTYMMHNSQVNRYFQTIEEHKEGRREFHQWADDYLQFSPLLVAGIFDASGIKSRNTLPMQTFQLIKTELIVAALVTSMKYATHKTRPDGSSMNSFPSGHTAEAFAAATFLHKEFGEGRPWLSVFMYSVAGLVGTMRVMNNRHWASDIVAGAGIGILSAEIAYHPNLQFHTRKTHPWI